MAAHGWGTDRPLEELLFEKGHLFEFYQAVRLLEVIYPEKIPIGEGSEPGKETVRFKSQVSHDFPASQISEIQKGSRSHWPIEMGVNFLGLAGCLGPLPIPYTELILERAWYKDTALKDFLDIFNHRLVSLLYRVRKIHRIGFDFKPPHKGHFVRYFFSLMGMGTVGLKDRMRLHDRALLNYTQLLAQQPRSMTGLEIILTDYFKVKIKGNQYCGHWHHLEDDQITQIGVSGENQVLGHNAVIGTKAWDQQGKFELVLGPLSLSEFLDFLPSGRTFTPLYQLTRFYVGGEYEFDLVLILKAGKIPESRMGSTDGPRLGWTSWLKTGKQEKETGRVRLSARLLSPWLKGESS